MNKTYSVSQIGCQNFFLLFFWPTWLDFLLFFSFSEVRKKCMHIIPLFVSSCAKMKNTCQLRLLQTLQAFFQWNSKCPRELTFTFHSLTHEHWIQFQAKKSIIPLSLVGFLKKIKNHLVQSKYYLLRYIVQVTKKLSNFSLLVLVYKMRNIFLCNLKSPDQSTNVIDQPAVHTGMKPSYFLREGLQKTRDLAMVRPCKMRCSYSTQ